MVFFKDLKLLFMELKYIFLDLREDKARFWVMSLVMGTKLVWPCHHILSSTSDGRKKLLDRRACTTGYGSRYSILPQSNDI